MQNSQITEAMLHGKMSYGRGADDGEGNNTPQMPPIITGAGSVPVCIPPSKSSPGTVSSYSSPNRACDRK